ncbi:retinoschisin-like [Actinia tenebrosa]|uniref:Retinoschisin-like n=1 Tax=Actinia tenebrosa TaxID=6105 RepID=A0A6P8HNM8_ACTTE|nr:retinoschisin-like [Actinia tenebrosa]XP_031557281.1 retinoschisin-like [Actinia tenebrosa]XP_031557282.1 retinoschisin-like [Actinia tenebrosa]XP_031557283.1 retinoschisin-like [Actinia tenebrosa]
MAFQALLMVLMSMILIGCTADQNDCRSVQSIGNRILLGHVTKTMTGKSFESCTIDCEKESDCFSINYLTVTATCQMNNTTVKWFPADFIPWTGALYMDSLVRQYESNPCNDRTSPCDGLCVPVPGQLPRTICLCLKTPVSNCQPDTRKPSALGMENGVIQNEQITSSTTAAASTNNMSRLNCNTGSWTPNTDDKLQWLQVSFVSQTKVFTQIATQGHGVNWWWVTQYAIDFKTEASHWQSYSEDGNTLKIFMGNTDFTGIVKNSFTKPFIADIIKIKPLEYDGRIALRIELYGCSVN